MPTNPAVKKLPRALAIAQAAADARALGIEQGRSEMMVRAQVLAREQEDHHRAQQLLIVLVKNPLPDNAVLVSAMVDPLTGATNVSQFPLGDLRKTARYLQKVLAKTPVPGTEEI